MIDIVSLPRVTVVTPSLNQGHFLRCTIESVLAQDYPNLEYIIMDGGSTDASAAIASEYQSRLRFISESDNGQTDAINKGFRLASGEILAWLNSDDLYLPGAVSKAVKALTANPSAGFVYGEGYLIDAAGEITRRFPHTQPFDLWRLVHLSDYILQQTCFFRRSALHQTGPLAESLRYGMDWDILIRLGARFPVVYLPQYLACLREYPAAKTSSGGAERARELHRLLIRHTRSLLPPGALVYGLDTYSQVAQRWVAGHGHPWFTDRGNALRLWCEQYIGNLVMHKQGVYADGWAGTSLHLMLHARQGVAILSGTIPSWAGSLAGQRLRVYAGGRFFGAYPVAGTFRLAVTHNDPAAPLSLRIEASRHTSSPTDPRRLAFLFGSFAWDPTPPVPIAPELVRAAEYILTR
jgi:glycosyltransferase involved in cell wall biosynthesis